jgi:hypothetical protein
MVVERAFRHRRGIVWLIVIFGALVAIGAATHRIAAQPRQGQPVASREVSCRYLGDRIWISVHREHPGWPTLRLWDRSHVCRSHLVIVPSGVLPVGRVGVR